MAIETLVGFGLFVGYYVVGATLLFLVSSMLKPPKELFRKMLHFICVLSIFVLVYAFETWHGAALAALAFALMVYPIITWLGRYPKVLDTLIQRRDGEIRSSLLLVFGMMALLITVFWGWLGEEWRFIVIAAVLAWGFGDAAAALVGKTWGRKPIQHRWLEGKKTLEGTLAMLLVAGATLLGCLLAYTQLPWYLCLLTAAFIAPLAAVAELFTHNGQDTVTVPLLTAFSLWAVLLLFSRIGWVW